VEPLPHLHLLLEPLLLALKDQGAGLGGQHGHGPPARPVSNGRQHPHTIDPLVVSTAAKWRPVSTRVLINLQDLHEAVVLLRLRAPVVGLVQEGISIVMMGRQKIGAVSLGNSTGEATSHDRDG
jgi:hypothetical protein